MLYIMSFTLKHAPCRRLLLTLGTSMFLLRLLKQLQALGSPSDNSV